MQRDVLLSKGANRIQGDISWSSRLGMTFTKPDDIYRRFLCACLTQPSREVLISHCADPGFDWESLVRLASEELILPLLYNRLDKIRDILPQDIAEVLRTTRDLAAERNSLIFKELRNAAYLANQLGIEPIALKGSAHLLRELYSSTSDRYLLDIDLLIPETAIKPFFRHLLENGYLPDFENPVGVDCHHELALRRPGYPPIELHRSVGMGWPKVLLPASDLIRDSVPTQFADVKIRTPSDEHILIHQTIHAQLNNPYRNAIWPDLREAFDCRLLAARLSANGQLQAIIKKLSHHRIAAILEVHFLTIVDILGQENISVPASVLHASSLAWLHRRLLRAMPALRFIDLYYLVRSAFLPRIYRLKDLAKSREGLLYVLKAPFRFSFYKSLWSEIV